MAEQQKTNALENLLGKLEKLADDRTEVSLHQVFDTIGHRSFGPWLLVAGLTTLSPLGGVPGVPSVMAVVILLVAVQLLLRLRHFWLPQWLLRRSASADKFRKAIRFMQKPARFMDRLSSARFESATRDTGARVIAILCIVIALGLPPMEFVPFSAVAAGLALTIFGLALILHDGLFAVIGVIFTLATYGFLLSRLL